MRLCRGPLNAGVRHRSIPVAQLIVVAVFGAVFVLTYHEAVVTFDWSLPKPFLVALAGLVVSVAVMLVSGPNEAGIAVAVVSYQFVAYFIVRYSFQRIERRELQPAFGTLNRDRRLDVDSNYWAAWGVVSMAVPVVLSDWLSRIAAA